MYWKIKLQNLLVKTGLVIKIIKMFLFPFEYKSTYSNENYLLNIYNIEELYKNVHRIVLTF